MVWYIPTTWFENLGSGVKRVSLYKQNDHRDVFDSEVIRYRLSCRVQLPNGEILTEEFWTEGRVPKFEGALSYGDQKRALRRKIREKYSKQEK